MFTIQKSKINSSVEEFCDQFINSTDKPRYIFGRNEYAESIASFVDVDGFVDDFTEESEYCGKPVLKTEDIPVNSMVLNAVVLGRPLSAQKRLYDCGIRSMDYFTFYRCSGLKIKPVTFWEDFLRDFKTNKKKYYWLFDILSDDVSKNILKKLIKFRLSGDLKYMKGFSCRQHEQYFEDFLRISMNDETFIDVGGYEGETSLEFMKRCKFYKAIHLFEPDKKNMSCAKKNLSSYRNVYFYEKGLSNTKSILNFEFNGSSSRVVPEGNCKIEVDRLDALVKGPVSFIKMDIEGSEGEALEGTREIIIKYSPKLAICVYHKGDDLWKIPELVLSFNQYYKIYLRHYTEGVVETVMYFVP